MLKAIHTKPGKFLLTVVIAVLMIGLITGGGGRLFGDVRDPVELLSAIENTAPLRFSAPQGERFVLTEETRGMFAAAADADEPVVTVGETENTYFDGRKKIADLGINIAVTDALVHSTGENIYNIKITKRGGMLFALLADSTGKLDSSCLWRVSLEKKIQYGDGTEEYTEITTMRVTDNKQMFRSPTVGILPGNYRLTVRCVNGYTDNIFGLYTMFTDSPDRETEPNDTRSRYTYLPRDKVFSASSSSYAVGSFDTDFYMTEIASRGFMTVYFKHEDLTKAPGITFQSQAGYSVKLTDEQGREYYSTVSAAEDDVIRSAVIGVEPGVYFIEVRSFVASNLSYYISVDFNAISGAETEINDTRDCADKLFNTSVVTGALSERTGTADVDCFKVDIATPSLFAVIFSHSPDKSEDHGGWNVTVTDTAGTVLYTVMSHWNDSSHQSPYIGVGAGTYYITVDSDNLYRSDLSYNLSVGWQASEFVETEPNNTPESADELLLGSYVGGALIERGVDFDTDVYKVDIAFPCALDIVFSHTKGTGTGEAWSIALYDAVGMELVRYGVSPASPETVSFSSSELRVGTYYLVVETGLYYSSDNYAVAVYAKQS
ncbi:MAG: hypothetical protein K6G90_11575 [Clostridia bacterium]|nr:hypothetical protein [Clostridia bacterium]